MKRFTRIFLQTLLGLPTYLYYFALYKINSLPRNPDEKHVFLFRELIPDNSLILDIGANLGFVTYHLAQKKGCQVMSFEPVPINLQVLNRLVRNRRLTNITVRAFALGNQDGQATMLLPSKKGSLMSGLSRVITTKAPGQQVSVPVNPDEQRPNNPHDPLQWPGERFTVDLKRLDGLPELTESQSRIGGIKIDAEGYEYYILEGGRSVIQQHKPVILVELWNNKDRQRSLTLLTELGYTVFRPTETGLTHLEKSDWQKDNMDFICTMQPDLVAQAGMLA